MTSLSWICSYYTLQKKLWYIMSLTEVDSWTITVNLIIIKLKVNSGCLMKYSWNLSKYF